MFAPTGPSARPTLKQLIDPTPDKLKFANQSYWRFWRQLGGLGRMSPSYYYRTPPPFLESVDAFLEKNYRDPNATESSRPYLLHGPQEQMALLEELGQALSSGYRQLLLQQPLRDLVPKGIIADIGCDYCFLQLEDDLAVQLQFSDLGFGADLRRLAQYRCIAGGMTWPTEKRTVTIQELVEQRPNLITSVSELPNIFSPLEALA